MKSIPARVQEASEKTPQVTAPARMDKKTKKLVKRLRPGEIAIIDHTDVDQVSAESLIEKSPSVVVNASCSATGRYPNLAPLMIIAAGISIIDETGQAPFEKLKEGEMITVSGNRLLLEDQLVATGKILSIEELERRIEESKENLGKHLGDFALNTMELIEAEKDILLETIDLPKISTKFSGSHALVVVRGQDYKRDLRILRPYIRETKPVLVAVDGGADALMEMGYKADIIVGDMDSVSDRALRSAAELVVHGYPDGRAPGTTRLDGIGIDHTVFHYPGTSEDIALLIPYEKGAELIVLVGGHNSLVDFMDKDRKGMASTFLVRLRVGSTLVDAKGVSRLYQTRIKGWHLAVMVLAALVTIFIVILLSEPVRQFFTVLAMRFQVWIMKLQRLI